MTPRSVSLNGCRSLAEAEDRVRAFLEAVAIESLRSFPPDTLADYIDDHLLHNSVAIEEALERFRALASEIYGDGTVH